jgi:hypothetical protein
MGAIASEVRLEMIHREVRAAGKAAWALYQKIIDKGETPEWAAMCALQQAPGTRNTDRAFCQGQQHKMNRMDPENHAKMVKMARMAGVDVGGKYYCGGLGDYTDPAAWVTCADDVIAVAKKKGLKIEGVINYTPPEKEVKRKEVVAKHGKKARKKKPS